MATTITIDDAVKAAVENESTVAATTTEETTAEVATENNDEVETAEARETREAVQLYRALANPKLAAGIIKEMAQAAGLDIGATKTEQKAVVKDVLETLKESLPEEQRFLAESMGPAIKRMIEEVVNNQTAPLRQQTEEFQVTQAKNEVESAFNNLAKKHTDIRKYEKEMNVLADKFALVPGTNLEEYIEGLYAMATADKKQATAVEKTVNKINRNLGKVLPASTQVDDTTIKRGSKLPTLNEAFAAGARGERLY